jgi:hypothetical protein
MLVMWEYYRGCVKAFATCAKLVQDLVDSGRCTGIKAGVGFGMVAGTEVTLGVDFVAVAASLRRIPTEVDEYNLSVPGG